MNQRRLRLEGKVAIVTGAGSSGPGIGNGKATSLLFAQEGAKVLLVDATAQRAQETLDMIRKQDGEASIFKADVTNDEACHLMVETAINRYGRLDILDNNVGVFRSGTVLDVKETDWDFVMDTNVKSIVLASRYAIPQMIKSGGGSIINISSTSGLRALRNSTSYSASKAAVIGLTKAMAADHGRDNIRVNCIAPGIIYTPMLAASLTNEMRQLRKKAVPLEIEGTGWDVAWAAVYLASDEARLITAAVIPVDAGLSAITPITNMSPLMPR